MNGILESLEVIHLLLGELVVLFEFLDAQRDNFIRVAFKLIEERLNDMCYGQLQVGLPEG